MKTFEEVQKHIVDFATAKKACRPKLTRATNATTIDDLLSVVKDNLSWVNQHQLFNGVNIQEFFSAEKLIEFGLWNSGEGNTGFANTGYSNTGDRNTGYRNTGYRNTGYRNTGDRNTGDRNTGDWNTGDWNTGDWNTGDWNTGDWNTGDWNTGYSNTGDRNTGAFCTGEPTIKIFNKESGWTMDQFQKSPAFGVMRRLETKIWVPIYAMTEAEKEKFPASKTAEGYIKDIPIKEAWINLWGNLSDEAKESFRELPNFTSEIFEEITGIKF